MKVLRSPKAWLSEGALTAMVAAAARAHPRETGGILVGVFAEGLPWITSTIEITSGESGAWYYRVPAGARDRSVRQARRGDARVGYLGEWHSHPSDQPPSATDIASMRALAQTGDSPESMLVVLRRTASGYKLDARQWTGQALHRVEIVAAGPLPPLEDQPRRRKHLRSARLSREG